MKKFFSLLVVIISILLVACKSKDENVIRIGTILPLSGPVANIGQENKAGIELALEKINKNAKRIDIIYEDGKGDAKTSVSAMKKLEMQGINKVILSTTQTVAPILSMYQNNEDFCFFANCLTKGIVDNTNNAIRLYFSSENETTMMANYILNNNFFKIATFRINTESGLEPVETTKQKVLKEKPKVEFFDQIFDFSEKDFKIAFANIKKFNPDIVLIYSYPDQWENIVRQLTEQKMNFPILANSGFGQTAEREFYQDLEIMKSIVFPSPRFVIDKDKPEVKQIVNDLKERYNVVANFNVLYLYDNMMVIADNLESSNNNRQFIEAICSKEYNGVTGKIAFNLKHDLKLTELLMVRIVNGEYELVNI